MVDAKDNEELQQLLNKVTIAAIGPITAKTVTESGLQVDIQPASYTITDMVNTIVDHYKSKATANME